LWGGARSERTQQLMEDFEWLLKDNERLRLEADELRAALDVATADRVYEQERTIATLREALRKRTKCATCNQGKYSPFDSLGQWVHLYEDGSLIGPCFDPEIAPALAATEAPERG